MGVSSRRQALPSVHCVVSAQGHWRFCATTLAVGTRGEASIRPVVPELLAGGYLGMPGFGRRHFAQIGIDRQLGSDPVWHGKCTSKESELRVTLMGVFPRNGGVSCVLDSLENDLATSAC